MSNKTNQNSQQNKATASTTNSQPEKAETDKTAKTDVSQEKAKDEKVEEKKDTGSLEKKEALAEKPADKKEKEIKSEFQTEADSSIGNKINEVIEKNKESNRSLSSDEFISSEKLEENLNEQNLDNLSIEGFDTIDAENATEEAKLTPKQIEIRDRRNARKVERKLEEGQSKSQLVYEERKKYEFKIQELKNEVADLKRQLAAKK